MSDAAGNTTEKTFSAIVTLDTTKPTLLWILYNGMYHLPNSTIVVDATSLAGAEVAYEVGASDPDNPTSALKVACIPPPSGPPFAIGTTIVAGAVSDPAGNKDLQSFSIHVKGAAEQIEDLIGATKAAFGINVWSDPAIRSIYDGLISNLDVALRDVISGDTAGACIAMSNYIYAVSNLTTLLPDKPVLGATELKESASRISRVLGCA